jgi:5-methylcytosine-specific restriction endonuclease McrA
MGKLRMLRTGLRTLDTRTIKPGQKQADPFYDTPEWRALRDQVRREAGGCCEWSGCESRGRYVDHRIERSDGGADLDRSNLWLLCPSHHRIKTVRARAARARRTDSATQGGGAVRGQ